MSAEEVLARVERLAPVKLVEITGGEPMLQERELIPLMEQLLAREYTLLLETSGGGRSRRCRRRCIRSWM